MSLPSCGTQNCLLVIHFAQFWPLRQFTLLASPTGRSRVHCPLRQRGIKWYSVFDSDFFAENRECRYSFCLPSKEGGSKHLDVSWRKVLCCIATFLLAETFVNGKIFTSWWRTTHHRKRWLPRLQRQACTKTLLSCIPHNFIAICCRWQHGAV